MTSSKQVPQILSRCCHSMDAEIIKIAKVLKAFLYCWLTLTWVSLDSCGATLYGWSMSSLDPCTSRKPHSVTNCSIGSGEIWLAHIEYYQQKVYQLPSNFLLWLGLPFLKQQQYNYIFTNLFQPPLRCPLLTHKTWSQGQRRRQSQQQCSSNYWACTRKMCPWN